MLASIKFMYVINVKIDKLLTILKILVIYLEKCVAACLGMMCQTMAGGLGR